MLLLDLPGKWVNRFGASTGLRCFFVFGEVFVVTKEEYLADPCGAASVPYWKTGAVIIPQGMVILHHREYVESPTYADEPYFRLRHDLQDLTMPVLPRGYSLCKAAPVAFAAHINGCYDGLGVTEGELAGYTTRPVYDAALWLAVRYDRTGEIVATGIGELDRTVGEGILEWIQVSPNHRGKGLGSYLVSELLRRMKEKADFATVSGQCNNSANPERLYRRCGFVGNDIWHILRKKETK